MANSTIVEIEYQDYATDHIGVSKDADVDENHPTWNYGGHPALIIEANAVGGNDRHTILQIVMPEEKDIVGFGKLIKVELKLHGGYITNNPVVAVIAVDDIWDEGTQIGAIGECNWTEAQPADVWALGDGIFASRHGSPADGEIILESIHVNVTYLIGAWFTFDLTESLSMGETKNFGFYAASGTKTAVAQFDSTEFSTPSTSSPILVLTYASYPPEGFEGDKGLTVEYNPDDREQSILKWGSIKDNAFQQYRIYRDTSDFSIVRDFVSNITAVSVANDEFTVAGDVTASFPVGSIFTITGSAPHNGRYTVVSATYTISTVIEVEEDITDPTVNGHIHHGIYCSTNPSEDNFIDTFAHVDGSTYYYKILAEDEDNYEDNALMSPSVSFTKPDITSATMTRTDAGAWAAGVQDVGTSVTMTVISPQKIKKIYIDWKDGSTSWYEFETVGVSQTATHIYSYDTGGAVTPDVRVQDDLGYWSDLTAGSNTIDVNDTTPNAKLIVNVKKATLGDEVTLNGYLSQPIASNATITKYEFKRDAADAWQDNLTDPVYTFDSGIYPNSVGSKTASLRITTSTAQTDTDSATYELETGAATPLVFSRATKIHELNHQLGQNKLVEIPLGSEGVEHEVLLSRRAERISLTGTSNHPNVADDIGLIRAMWLSNTYVAISVSTEMEDKIVTYNCMIDGDVSLGQAYDNKQSWSFPVRVISRTEV
ncbi:MAG: hypothetical protein ACTSVR_04870 [Candidatus Thorarchaeota archaeon]